MSNRQPSSTKRGPGRFHREGVKRPHKRNARKARQALFHAQKNARFRAGLF